MKLAIAGTGKIVHEALEALRYVPQIEKTCIYARPHSEEKGLALAKEHGIPGVYTDYKRLLADPDVDFVYIGLVNAAHYSYAKEALLAGKNIIMEKPFTSTAAEAQELSEIALRKKLYVFEAVTCLHSAVFDHMKSLMPSLGPVRLVQCNYSQYSTRYDNYLKGIVEPCFDPSFSGGTLYDINIYNLNLLAALFGEPDHIAYYANLGFNGIDISGIVLCTYPGFTASAAGAKDSDSPSFFMVQGEKGWLRIPERPSRIASLESCINGVENLYRGKEYPHRMAEEFVRFERMFREKDYEAMRQGLAVSEAVLRMAEKARKYAGIRFAVDDQPPHTCDLSRAGLHENE